jgi:hypothetical protein
MSDLGSLNVTAINNKGQILGTNGRRIVLLTPRSAS